MPPGRVVDDHGQVPVALAVGDLVDSDPLQARQQVVRVAAVGDHPGDDVGDGAPRDPQHDRHHAQRGVRGQPRAGVLEQVGALRAGPRPRHVRHHHPVLGAAPPAARRPAGTPSSCRHPGCATVVHRRRRRSPGTAVRQREQRPHRGRLGPHPQHQHLARNRLLALQPGLDLDVDALEDHVLVTETVREYPGHAQRRTPLFVLNLRAVQNVRGTRRCAQIPRSATHYNVTRARPDRESKTRTVPLSSPTTNIEPSFVTATARVAIDAPGTCPKAACPETES